VPDLTALLDIMRRRDPREIDQYVLRRRLAIGDLERRIEASKSPDMIEVLRRRIDQENNAIKIALTYAPFEKASVIFSGRDFFRLPGFFPVALGVMLRCGMPDAAVRRQQMVVNGAGDYQM